MKTKKNKINTTNTKKNNNSTNEDNILDEKLNLNKEDTLNQIIIKYKEALKTQKFIPLKERETDRIELSKIDDRDINKKILTSYGFLQLSKVNLNQAKNLLIYELTPKQRLEMVSLLVSSLAYPIIFVPSKRKLLYIQKIEEYRDNVILIDQNEFKKEENKDKNNIKISTDKNIIKFKEYTKKKLNILEKKVKEKLQKYNNNLDKIDLTYEEAEVLSQLLTSGKLNINFSINNQNNKNLKNEKIVIVLKG